jgi:CDP-diacylglycerol---serine O-phosphatidyltransferase
MITLLNLAAGFTAIIYIADDKPVIAAWLIVAAMIFDFSDGFAAKLLRAYSELGKQLDSLADVVSFGVVPGLLSYHLLREAVAIESWVTMVLPVMIPLAGALRLARFNIDTTQNEYFRGMPIPAAALAIVSLVLAEAYGSSQLVASFNASPIALSITTVAISALMLSPLRMISLKFSSFRLKENASRFILIIGSVLLLISGGIAGIVLIIPLYVLTSVFDRLIR